jgi:hypothetical protein
VLPAPLQRGHFMSTPTDNLDPMVQAICNALQPFARDTHTKALETTLQLYTVVEALFAELSHDGQAPHVQALGAA